MEARDESDDRRAHLTTVVEHREGEAERVFCLADGEAVLTGLAERRQARSPSVSPSNTASSFGEPNRLLVAADEQDARHSSRLIRHGSV